jgi:hypothetical protein
MFPVMQGCGLQAYPKIRQKAAARKKGPKDRGILIENPYYAPGL